LVVGYAKRWTQEPNMNYRMMAELADAKLYEILLEAAVDNIKLIPIVY